MPRYLKTEEAAEHAGFSGSCFRKLRCWGGGPPFIKVGSAVRYDQSALDAWMAERTRSSTKDEAPAAA